MTEEEIKQRMQEECRHVFDLQSPPFMRCIIGPAGPTEHVVLILMHHIIMDGWSFGQLWGNLIAFYQSVETGAPALLPELPVQYSDFAAWEGMQLEAGSLKHANLVAYWKHQLAGATPVIQLPTDFMRVADAPSQPPVVVGTRIDGPTTTALKKTAAHLKASLYSLCAAAYRVVLCEFGATDDVIIASTYSVRPPGTENLVCSILFSCQGSDSKVTPGCSVA